ncbi:MAG TPA: septum formation family protein [Microbacterium sp.]|jgi:hypothetical protein|uniref:septum formation family protein n=1 Tax=Microbacterium sp. TaxID=51671 RepID=UPI002F940A48
MNNRRARISLAAVVVAAAVSLSGCSIIDQFLPSSQPVRDAETGEVTEQVDNADVFAIRVGDCLNTADMDTTEEVSDVPVVPCDEPHDDEVFYSYSLADGEYPGEDAIIADADTTCIAEFGTFIGLAYESSTLDYWPMYPTTGSWESGDREVLCIAWDPSGAKLTGTLAGAAR